MPSLPPATPPVDAFVEPCDCYECVGSRLMYDEDGHASVQNNLKRCTLGKACDECGRPRTEHRDLGTKGYFECWWCTKRAADVEPEPEPPLQTML